MLDPVNHLLFVYTAYVIAVASPGPSTMRIMGTAMHQGRRAALMVAAGVVTGSVFWGVMATGGVSAVLIRYAGALIAIKVAGGLYLLYLALKSGLSAMTRDDGPSTESKGRSVPTAHALYRQGLLLHLANPKSVLGWIAFVTLGLGPNATPRAAFAILAGCFVISVIIFGGYAVAFSTAPMVRAYRHVRRGLEGLLAAFFAAAGLNLLFSKI